MPHSIKSRLGEIIHNYRVIAQFEDKIILAEAVNPSDLDKAVVWRLDYYGSPYNGSYFDNMLSAQHEFAMRAFGW